MFTPRASHFKRGAIQWLASLSRPMVLAWLVGGWLAFGATQTSAQEVFEPLRITRIVRHGQTITIEWTGGVPPYRVQAREGLLGPWTDVSPDMDGGPFVQAMDPGAHFFRVVGQADVLPPPPPGKMRGVASGINQMTLMWATTAKKFMDPTVERFRLYREGQLIQEVPAPTNWVVDTTFVPGASYVYCVTSVDRFGRESKPSVMIQLATGFRVSSKNIGLVWDPNPEPDIGGYKVYYGYESGHYTESFDVGNVTYVRISGLRPDVVYYFVVTAYNMAGLESLPSNEVSYP